jgi:hypothetical protein
MKMITNQKFLVAAMCMLILYSCTMVNARYYAQDGKLADTQIMIIQYQWLFLFVGGADQESETQKMSDIKPNTEGEESSTIAIDENPGNAPHIEGTTKSVEKIESSTLTPVQEKVLPETTVASVDGKLADTQIMLSLFSTNGFLFVCRRCISDSEND